MIDLVPRRLLGGAVSRSADGGPDAGEPGRRAVVVVGDRQAEVGDARDAVGDDHVVGLEVAMDQAALVGVREAVAQPARDRHHLGDRRRPGVDPSPQGRALDEVHDDVQEAGLRPPEVDHSHHVGVIERARRLGLLREAQAHRQGRRQIADQHLHREGALREPRVVRAVHPSHRALADQRLDHVVLAERGADQRIVVALVDRGAIDRAAREVAAVDRAAPRAAAQPTGRKDLGRHWGVYVGGRRAVTVIGSIHGERPAG